MARSQHRSKLKSTGGRYHQFRTKRKQELAGFPAMTRLADKKKTRVNRTIGGHHKMSLIAVKKINVADKQGKTTSTDILTVIENPANPNLVLRNIITKGTVVETKRSEE